MGLSCGMKCLKYLLFSFNFILFLIGVALLAVGIFVAVDANKLFELLKHVDMGSLDVKGLLEKSAYVIIAFGAFVFLVAFLGCCGAIKESRCMLGTYATIVCICLLVEIAAVILAAVFWDHTKKELGNYFNRTIIEEYNGYNGVTKPTEMTDSYALDFIMVYFKCCGRFNSKDFIPVPTGKWNATLPNGKTAMIPVACCKMVDNEKFPNNMTIEDKNCPTTATETNSYMNDGCQTKLEEKISKYAVPIIAVSAAVAFLQLFVVIAGCCLCHRIGKDDD